MLISMKYTINSKGLLHYRRRWPTRLKSHPQCKGEVYVKSLGLRDDAPDEDKLQAWKQAHADYENFITGLSLANEDVLDAVQSLRIAESTLRAKGLEPGMLAPNPMLTDMQHELIEHEAWQRINESGVLSATENRDNPLHERYGQPLNAEEAIAESAYKLLTKPGTVSISTTLLSDCWEPYKD